jgi:hypothetical protein
VLGAAKNCTAIAKKKIIELKKQQSYKQLILKKRVIKLKKEVDLT